VAQVNSLKILVSFFVQKIWPLFVCCLLIYRYHLGMFLEKLEQPVWASNYYYYEVDFQKKLRERD
jgi:hypothetical protein